MRTLTLVKRVAGWIGLIGLPLSLLTMQPAFWLGMSIPMVAWIWAALSWTAILALVAWSVCKIACLILVRFFSVRSA